MSWFLLFLSEFELQTLVRKRHYVRLYISRTKYNLYDIMKFIETNFAGIKNCYQKTSLLLIIGERFWVEKLLTAKKNKKSTHRRKTRSESKILSQ